MTVIMGRAKSGKSPLLRALSGRLPDMAKTYGDVFVNGVKSRFPYGAYDEHGELSSVNMDTAVAIRTLESTYKSSTDAAAVETMISKLTEKEGSTLKSEGKTGIVTTIAVLTWCSLLIMSREWK